MFAVRQWSMRKKVAAATALALLLLAPMGISQQPQPTVTGHSTFYNGNGFDPCLASVAGIMRTQVLWFNDQVLAERYGGKGTYVWITENNSGDPRAEAALYSDGTSYDITDPNGVFWHIDEAFWSPGESQVRANPTGPPTTPGAVQDRQYVWIVELSGYPIHDQFAGGDEHDVYNFLDIVNTCHFHRNYYTNADPKGVSEGGNFHNPDGQHPNGWYDFNITHDNGTGAPGDLPRDELSPAHGHPYGTKAHTHETFMADIWVGGKPVLIPIGANGGDPVKWESDWTTGGASPTQDNNAGTLPTSGGNPP